MTLVDIKGLRVDFAQHGSAVQAVRGVSLHVEDGESLGIVGESGSGKSVTFMALLRLLGGIAKVTADSMTLVVSSSRRRPPHTVGNARQICRDGVPGSMTAFDPVFSIGQRSLRRSTQPKTPRSARHSTKRSTSSSGSRSAMQAMCWAITPTNYPAACCSAR